MAEEHENPPAFPIVLPDDTVELDDIVAEGCAGMTLRDYFAAAALPETLKRHAGSPSRAAEVAYEFADAMLKERKGAARAQ